MPPKKDSKPKKESAEGGGDQLQQWRERCADKAADLKNILEECNERVRSRKKTGETCAQEMLDYVKKIDECAVKKAFAELR
ncbi:hypothetical protein KIN20_006042 [Parelaphostrongylus tenuis]|uniref:Cytochrome b-c1 complex subunit 6 n=1 Tax=Parelaphostrongylus tenuis TaxID=148309 RepID=A0AAD5M5F8_PARTN|nr:hypothetical protein KIN20_006042 [Parelaphostrongylus tenuis]